jgi:uncharacterized membrane protein YeiH
MIEYLLLEFFMGIGTIAFAMSGSYEGIRHKLDILGIYVLGFSTAIGGGLVRDTLLNRTPFAFINIGPALYALIGCLLATIFNVYFKGKKTPFTMPAWQAFLILDAIGLAGFTVWGAQLGMNAGLNVFGVIILASATGFGGGILRDLLVREVPLILREDFYATAAIIGALVYVVVSSYGLHGLWASGSAFFVTLVLRMLAIKYKWHLPKL